MIPLAVVLLLSACMAFCAWSSPNYLRELAARLLARAEAVESSRVAHATGLAHWRLQLKIERPTAARVRMLR